MRLITAGGDLRQKTATQILLDKGLNVIEYKSSLTKIDKEDILLLPTPVTRDKIHLTAHSSDEPICLEEIIRILPLARLVIGGAYSNRYVIDVTKRDDFAYYNAIPTAEGAIKLAIENTSKTLWNSKILVCGFGRVAKILISRLKGFYPKLYVSARNSTAFSLIDSFDIEKLHTNSLAEHIGEFDIVFNTVDAPLFNAEVLKCARKDTLFIELASADAGFVKEAVIKSGIRFLSAPALPGKTAPTTAGQIMAETVLNILRENHLF